MWDTAVVDPLTPLLILGKGFFFRAVCAVAFSHDDQFVVAVGCDDYHMVAVFDLAKGGELICQATGQKGLPPLIKWLRYCPGVHCTDHISREHTVPCDVFATAGTAPLNCSDVVVLAVMESLFRCRSPYQAVVVPSVTK